MLGKLAPFEKFRCSLEEEARPYKESNIKTCSTQVTAPGPKQDRSQGGRGAAP